MKVLLESWKRYIKESEEEDFAGIEDWNNDELGHKNYSIAWGKSKKPEYVQRAAEIFKGSKEDWFFISVSNVLKAKDDIAKEPFKNWISSLNIPKGTKIIVAGSSSYEGDLQDPEWLLLHDIIGHSAGKKFLDNLGYKEGSAVWITSKKFRMPLIQKLHSLLPKSIFKVVDKEQDKFGEFQFDKLYDIFSAIISGHLKREIADSVAQSVNEKEMVDQLFRGSKEWVDSIPDDTPTIVTPW